MCASPESQRGRPRDPERPGRSPGPSPAKSDAFLSLAEECRRQVQAAIEKAIGPRLRGRVEAADVLQEVLFDGAREFGRYFPDGQPAREEFLAWIRTVIAHRIQILVRHHLRAQRRTADREERLGSSGGASIADPRGRTPSSEIMQGERRGQVEEALQRLPESWRKFVRLVYFEGLDVGEAGDRMGWTRKTTYSTHWKVLDKLGKLLKEEEES